MLVLQRLEHEHPATRQQRAPQLEARVLGRRADQGDRAALDPREERVLLRLVEVVDLVAEQDRAPPLVLKPLRRLLDDLPHPSHAFRDSRERLEVAIGVMGDDFGERRLSRARRPPEDAGSDLAPADQLAQGLPGTEQVLLAEELVQGGGPHAGREGLGGALEQGGISHAVKLSDPPERVTPR